MNVTLEKELQSQAFASRLEKGMQVMFRKDSAPPEEYRLRAPYCSVVSSALVHYLRHAGVSDVHLVQSESEALEGVAISHSYVLAGDTVVDPTYSRFLSLAGYTPREVQLTGRDMYPAQKIGVCPDGDPTTMIEALARVGETLVVFEHGESQTTNPGTIRDRQPGEFTQAISGIWDPTNRVPQPNNERMRADWRFGALIAARLISTTRV